MEFKEIKFFVFIPACIAAVVTDILCFVGMVIDLSGRITVSEGVFILLAVFAVVFVLGFILLPHILPDPSIYLEEDKMVRDSVKLFAEKSGDRVIRYDEIVSVDYSKAKKHAKNGIFLFKYNEVEIKIERVDKKPVYVHPEDAPEFLSAIVDKISADANIESSADKEKISVE